jgi:hypothetical protein
MNHGEVRPNANPNNCFSSISDPSAAGCHGEFTMRQNLNPLETEENHKYI